MHRQMHLVGKFHIRSSCLSQVYKLRASLKPQSWLTYLHAEVQCDFQKAQYHDAYQMILLRIQLQSMLQEGEAQAVLEEEAFPAQEATLDQSSIDVQNLQIALQEQQASSDIWQSLYQASQAQLHELQEGYFSLEADRDSLLGPASGGRLAMFYENLVVVVSLWTSPCISRGCKGL